MTGDLRTRGARTAGLQTLRTLCRAVAVVAAAIGVAFAILAVIGPSVWVFSSDGSGAGSFSALPLALRIPHALSALFTCLTVAVAALLLAELTRHVRDGVRFEPALSRTVWALAATLAFGPGLAQIAGNVARWSTVVEPDASGLGAIEWVSVPQAIAPSWGMLGVAVVLAVLASIISAGERLQRETEGLV